MEYKGFRDLRVYQLSFQLALEVFEISKSFLKEEKYTLTDQIRRSSRAVSALLAEAWTHRKYPKSFISKLVDSKGEADETEVWIDFAQAHCYIDKEKQQYLLEKYNEVGKMSNSMINQPEKFCH
ncbi:MAG: four helix bundle protein [Bacteroidales bacterium]|jgi:four helix bundle protein